MKQKHKEDIGDAACISLKAWATTPAPRAVMSESNIGGEAQSLRFSPQATFFISIILP